MMASENEVNLTKRSIDSITHPAVGRVKYKFADLKYLRLYVTPTAKVFYYLRKKTGNKAPTEERIGSFPDITPDQARAKVEEINARITFGEDVSATRKSSRMTWGELWQRYFEDHVTKRLRSKTQDEYADKNRVHLDGWKNVSIASINTAMVEAMHRKAAKRRKREGHKGKPIGGPRTADMTLNLVRDVFNWAMRTKPNNVVIRENPAVAVTRFQNPREQARKRVLNADEMARFMRALNDFNDQEMADYFRLLLFTGQRRSSVMSMRCDRVDMKERLWAYDKTKNGDDMRVALSDPAIAILRRRWKDSSGDYVFPSRRADSKIPHLSEPRFAFERIMKAAKIEGVRIHDLRRTFGTWLAAGGASEYQIMRALGHRDSQSTKIYVRLAEDATRDPIAKTVDRMLASGQTDKY